TALVKTGIASSTQNQAMNAVIFFYQEVLGVEIGNIDALRARRPIQVRRAPSREETLQLIKVIHAHGDFAVSLVVRLLYGCGLRVTEPLNLRIKDVKVESTQFIVRAAKGGNDGLLRCPAHS